MPAGGRRRYSPANGTRKTFGDILAREPLEALARPAASVRRLTDRKCQDALQRALLRLGVGEAGLSSAPASVSGATVRAQVRIRM